MSYKLSEAESERIGRELEDFANRVVRDTAEVFASGATVDKISGLTKRVSLEVDGSIDKYRKEANRLNQACKKGCCWCCHDIVLASVPEIISIFRYVQTHFDAAQMGSLLERLTTYEASMESKRSKTFTFTKVMCPLLVNSECSIYEARPLSCRGKSSSDANLCRMWKESPGDGGTITFFIAQHLVYRAVEQGFAHGCKHTVGQGVHELNRCLNLLLQDPTLAEDVLAGRRNFPVPVFPSKPKQFPLDLTSISPPPIPPSPMKDAIWNAQMGLFAEADRLVNPKSGTGAFVQMRSPGLYSSFEQILEFRERIESALDYLDTQPLNVIELLPALVDHTPSALVYQGLPVRSILEKQGRIFQDKIVSKVYPRLCDPIDKPRKPGPFRLGYMSVLNLNNGSRWALGWAKNHGRGIETYGLNLGPEDIASKMWADTVNHYYNLVGNLQRIAEFVRDLDLDALIFPDLGFRQRDYFYSCMRLARVQCTGWGVPTTSGIPSIDYYLSSDLMEPENAQEEYTEKLVRLPRSGLCYPRPKTSFWTEPFQRQDPKFFPFMAQNLLKWTPQRDYLLKRIYERHGEPLKMVALKDQEPTMIFSKRMAKEAIAHELLPSTFQMGYANYLHSADVSFDPPDWSGGNTTIEALSYGVPVVALPGPYMRGRHSLAFLQLANVPGLIAKDEEDYLDLIFDEDRRREAMRDLDVDALYDDKGVVTALDEFLLSASPGA